MKRFLLTTMALMGLGLMFNTAAAQSGNGNSQGNRAIAASSDCWRPFEAQHSTVEAELYIQGHCINGNSANTYAIVVYYHCPPNIAEFCRPAPPRVAAYVSFDCANDISVVTCVE